MNPNILLDILFEKHDYPRMLSIPVQSQWIKSDEIIEVKVPSLESILGDKLTAFAPNTTGILYGKGKEQEIIKQLFDIGCLFDEAENVEEVALSFERVVAKEIEYRELEIDTNEILDDIFNTSLLIAKRDKNKQEPFISQYGEIVKGIRSLSSYLMELSFYIEDAILFAGKAAYLVNKLKNKDYSSIEKFKEQDINELEITGELNFLNKLKKSKNKASFFYWYKAVNV